jgi:Protein of unknown function (DUF2628)
MSVYTVHEPPLRAGGASADPERLVFVRDGFYFWAFLLTALWMLWHRLWLVLLIYVVVAVGLDFAMYYAGVPSAGVAVVELLISLLVGIEAGTLRRFTLARRGWNNIGVVSGDDVENAERRFYDGWVRSAAGKRVAPSALSPGLPPPPPSSRSQQSPDIIGLFPEPGANR